MRESPDDFYSLIWMFPWHSLSDLMRLKSQRHWQGIQLLPMLKNVSQLYLEHWAQCARGVLNKSNTPLYSYNSRTSWYQRKRVECFGAKLQIKALSSIIVRCITALEACEPAFPRRIDSEDDYPSSHFPPPLWSRAIINWTGSPDCQPRGPLNRITS